MHIYMIVCSNYTIITIIYSDECMSFAVYHICIIVNKLLSFLQTAMPQGIVPYPFGECRICRAQATGIHYGVSTCEGCKVRVRDL